MLYTEDTRIEALAVHVVGNKSKDEPLTVSPELSAQVADEGLMRTLTAYFLGGFKSEECYNLHHETDLGCNEVWNFACRIFDDPEALLEHSVSLAKHLYESGMHPQIKGGEFYTAYFSDCNFGGERCDALGLFKSETRDTFLDVEQQAGGVHIAAREGIATSNGWTREPSFSTRNARRGLRSSSSTTPTAPKHATGSTTSCACASGRTTTTIRTTRWRCARNTSRNTSRRSSRCRRPTRPSCSTRR